MPPSFSTASSPAPDALLSGEFPRATEEVTVVTPENLVRGTVVGKITVSTAAPTSAPFAGNTGNGVMGAITTGAGAKPGVYKVIIVEPATNAGTFTVEDPDGITVGRGTVAVAFAGALNFTLADGATDFVAGDGFDITVAAGTGKAKKAVAAATDGSQNIVGILVEDVDATAADKKGSIYKTGTFNGAALTFGAGHSATTAATIDALKALNIYLKPVVAA